MCIGEVTMIIKQEKGFLPCTARCGVSCAWAGWASALSLILIFSVDSDNLMIGLSIFIFFVVLSVFLTIMSIFKWNSRVVVTSERIIQRQFGKIIDLPYDKIDNVKISKLGKFPYLIKLTKDKEKISFDCTSKVYKAFVSTCTNQGLIENLKKLWKKRGLDL